VSGAAEGRAAAAGGRDGAGGRAVTAGALDVVRERAAAGGRGWQAAPATARRRMGHHLMRDMNTPPRVIRSTHPLYCGLYFEVKLCRHLTRASMPRTRSAPSWTSCDFFGPLS